jgi:hypothetical protein
MPVWVNLSKDFFGNYRTGAFLMTTEDSGVRHAAILIRLQDMET